MILNIKLWNLIVDKSLSPDDVIEDDILKVRLERVVMQQVEVLDGVEHVVGLDSIEIDEAGTGFLTDCGKFITARHCIEPWLDESPEDTSLSLVNMALEVYNYYPPADNVYRRLVSKGAVYRIDESDGCRESLLFRFSSDTSFASTQNDCIENIGSVSSPRYWVSLGHVYKISSIGDIVCFNVPFKGNLQLAPNDQVLGLKKNITA